MQNQKPYRWINPALWPLLLYMAVIFALSSIPDDSSFSGPALLLAYPNLNNVLHIPLFAGLTLLCLRYLHAAGFEWRRAELYTACGIFAFAFSDELHQYFVPGRFASITDLLLDAFGIALAIWWSRRTRTGFKRSAQTS